MTASPSALGQALQRPGRALEVAWALAKGHWYRFWARLRGHRFTAGRNFRVYGRLVLQGDGQVTLGDNVVLYGRVTPWTYGAAAKIEIGDNCVLDGVRFGCAMSISIGRDCLFAECRVLDTDFHSTRADRRSNPDAPVRTAPVVVGDNAWICADAGLLPGTRIGKNSVVGLGTVCVRRYPDNVILFGNPAQVVAPVALGDARPPDPAA